MKDILTAWSLSVRQRKEVAGQSMAQCEFKNEYKTALPSEHMEFENERELFAQRLARALSLHLNELKFTLISLYRADYCVG